jgi:hypothetical protein
MSKLVGVAAVRTPRSVTVSQMAAAAARQNVGRATV